MEKRFKHDCDICVFLGQFNEYDLYFCDAGFATVIARYGDDGPEYMSGMTFARNKECMPLYEAKQRAIKENLYGE